MTYRIQATQTTPALIIYLLDISGSMNLECHGQRRLDLVMQALQAAIRQMVFRSTKGTRMSPRYRVAMLAYSDEVYDLLGGVKRIDELIHMGGIPAVTPMKFTNTALAFEQAEKILKTEWPQLQQCPAPLICHLTDGSHTGEDPEPIAKRIMDMQLADGNVLISNIYISESMTVRSPIDVKRWTGVLPTETFDEETADKLKRMSSVIPESYRDMMLESSYSIGSGALMLFPGNSPELISLGFQMSAATPVRI
ncbi:vWA domain-containing protein [Paenibacillus sp. 481]|uniref:vWA domain-containing protein n=1 Tax=Paenibacillus sp. 481 TaxID=2835869 RepID=UPI001E316071|nr:vWA domain-containing protein [Paenibacillus sp. 481]UHA72076.1 VWA domain-containing protein [Paenibacillus sp. 481]